MNQQKIIAILGPTCSGKSDLAAYLAQRFPLEIVNYDSLQVYKYFDIGTAKPERALRERIPHHLLDIKEPEEDFNAALFVEEAEPVVWRIWERGRLPLFVGGTGLYLRAFLYGLFRAEKDRDLRLSLERAYSFSKEALYEKLKEIDREYAMRISINDKVRIIRALEIYHLTGKTLSELKKIHGFRELRYNVLKIGLIRPREDLYRRIEARVEDMLKRGWIEEVETLLEMGLPEKAKPFSAIGYREILAYLKGFFSFEEMVRKIKKFTRHYAKRQITWFSKESNVEWFSFPEEREKIERRVRAYIENGD